MNFVKSKPAQANIMFELADANQNLDNMIHAAAYLREELCQIRGLLRTVTKQKESEALRCLLKRIQQFTVHNAGYASALKDDLLEVL